MPRDQRQKTPKFHSRVKAHKKGNPGPSVVNSVNFHMSNISKYVDYYLQPIVEEIPWYVKNTKEFIQKLNQIEKIPEDNLLVTLYVKSLYTSIPNNKRIKAIKESW